MQYAVKAMEDIVNNNLCDYTNKSKIDDISIILALSGGIDSMVLADILLKINKDFKFNLNFFHMNYNMHSNSD